jgi:hypothetical protein
MRFFINSKVDGFTDPPFLACRTIFKRAVKARNSMVNGREVVGMKGKDIILLVTKQVSPSPIGQSSCQNDIFSKLLYFVTQDNGKS